MDLERKIEEEETEGVDGRRCIDLPLADVLTEAFAVSA
jgi:hypothetical protein